MSTVTRHSGAAVSHDAMHAFREALIDVVWTQWKTIGGNARTSRTATAIIDPEALLCVSLALYAEEIESRAWDVMVGWLQQNSHMISLARLRTLIAEYTPAVQAYLPTLAQAIPPADPRWRSLASQPGPASPRGKIHTSQAILSPGASVMLRLRLAMGMTAKSDLLAVLLGTGATGATIAELAVATRYTPIGLRQSADEMVAAGILQMTTTRPARYYANRATWRALTGTPAPWRAWHTIFTFGTALLRWWQETAVASDITPYLHSRALRNLIDPLIDTAIRIGMPLPPPAEFVGATYVDAFEVGLPRIAEWLARMC